VCLTSLVVLAVVLNIRSITADLVLMAVLFGWQLAKGVLALTRLHVHYDCDGRIRFRYDRPNRGVLAWRHRWVLDESVDAEKK
jgi:hypothetical protein